MDHKIYRLALIAWGGLLVAGPSFMAATPGVAGDSDVLLQVHLPRQVKVQSQQLNLGQVSVIRGPGAVVAKASRIGLGRFSMPGQEVVLDRPTILSRLASSGIFAAQVRLTGAEAVTVRREQEIIETEDFIEAARQFLQQYPVARSASTIIPIVRPKDLVLPELPEQLTLTPKIGRRATHGHVTVQIQVAVNGRDVGTRNVSFRLRYKRHRAVAAEQMAKGTVLSVENVKIETTESDRPEPVGWKPPYGQVVIRTLPAGAEIRPDMIGSAQSAVVVRRNETVQIRLERPGIIITAMGTALQEAHAGECLKVRNADSRRVIMCRVKADGTVEPTL